MDDNCHHAYSAHGTRSKHCVESNPGVARYIMVKPDGVQRGLVGEIIKRSAALEAKSRDIRHVEFVPL